MAELGKNPFAQSTKSKFTGFPTAVGKNPFVQQPQKALTEEEALQQATMAGGKTIPGKVAKFGLDLVGSILNPFAKASVGPALEYSGLVEPKKLQNVPLLGNIRPPKQLKRELGLLVKLRY